MRIKVVNQQDIGEDCIICGYKNDAGLKALFYELENKEVYSTFTMQNHHQSYPERAHGGMIGAILDETIGRAIKCFEAGGWGVTIELNIRYKKPVPLGVPLTAIGRIDSIRSRMFKGTGEIYLPNGEIAATAKGTYIKMKAESISSADFDEVIWGSPKDTDVPEFVDVYLNQEKNSKKETQDAPPREA